MLVDRTVVVDNAGATIGGIDVSNHPQLSMAQNVDGYPPEARWLLFNTPVTGALPLDASSATPLEVTYRMTALDGRHLTLLDMAFWAASYYAVTAPVEFAFFFDNGMSSTFNLQAGSAERVFGAAPANVTAMDVRVRVFGTADRGGSAIGLFAGTAPPDVTPVPEPGTMALLASGLVMAGWARRRR